MSTRWNPIGVVALTLAVLPTAAFAAGPAAPTFTKDIAPIFQEKCEACHRPDSIAPMSLVTYEESRPWARSIKTRVEASPDAAMEHRQDGRHPGIQERPVAERRADRDDRPLDRQRRAEGRHEGHARSRCSGRTIRAGTSPKLFGQKEPDLVLHSTPWTQKAGANDTWWRPVVATGLTEDRWVRAIEIRPSTVKGRKITHHAIARLACRTRPTVRSRRTTSTRTATFRPARSWNGPSASRAR